MHHGGTESTEGNSYLSVFLRVLRVSVVQNLKHSAQENEDGAASYIVYGAVGGFVV